MFLAALAILGVIFIIMILSYCVWFLMILPWLDSRRFKKLRGW